MDGAGRGRGTRSSLSVVPAVLGGLLAGSAPCATRQLRDRQPSLRLPLWATRQPADDRSALYKTRRFPLLSATNLLIGTWTYRSFLNEQRHLDDVNQLLYGEGDLVIVGTSFGEFAGRLDLGAEYQLDLRGSISYGLPFIVRFQGVGVASSRAVGWVYDYTGFAVPVWPNGVGQRPAIVGSNIRTVPHDGGSAPAGVVASWFAVKQDVG